MIICFRCTAETKANLDRLVASGLYCDYDEAISAAVRNQVLMEQEVGDRGAMVIGEAAAASHGQTRSNGRTSDPSVFIQEKVQKSSPSKNSGSPEQASLAPSFDRFLFRLDGF